MSSPKGPSVGLNPLVTTPYFNDSYFSTPNIPPINPNAMEFEDGTIMAFEDGTQMIFES